MYVFNLFTCIMNMGSGCISNVFKCGNYCSGTSGHWWMSIRKRGQGGGGKVYPI